MVHTIRRKKRVFLKRKLVILLILIGFVGVFIYQNKLKKDNSSERTNPTQAFQAQKTSQLSRKSYSGTLSAAIFVPYWQLSGTFETPQSPTSQLDTLIYFGLTPTQEALINTEDDGYKRLKTFVDMTKDLSVQKLLTLRMLNEDTNTAILENVQLQNKLIAETLSNTDKYDFDGIILDLEHSVIPTTDVTEQILAFANLFSEATHTRQKTFSITLYGDTYYRARPYDVAKLAILVDHIYIMAYDFHKSYGLPGPNFPLSTGPNATYSYSFERMLEDFSKDVPSEKIQIVFGLFGYDWSVDDQGRPAKAADPYSLNKVESLFEPTCTYKACTKRTDAISAENEIRYTDSSGQKHYVWYENPDSIAKKTEMARSFGISSIGFWAHGYY